MKIAGKTLSGCAIFGIIAVGLLFVVGAIAAVVIGSYYDNREVAHMHQDGLTAQYKDNQNVLSAYSAGFFEQAGIADRQTDALDDILQNAIRGRYDEGGANSGTLASSITEAYPDLDLDIYERIIDFIQAKRTDFAEHQTLMLSKIQTFNTWRTTGRYLDDYFRRGYPNERLIAQTGDEILTGEAALRKMGELVLLAQTVEEFDSGEMDPLVLPPRGGSE